MMTFSITLSMFTISIVPHQESSQARILFAPSEAAFPSSCASLFDVGVWCSAPPHTLRQAHTPTAIFTQRQWERVGGWWWGERGRLTRFLSSRAGGLYGWEWRVFSATGIAPAVPPKVSQDQPEGRAADHHRHGRPLSDRQAAHRTGIPYGQSHQS